VIYAVCVWILRLSQQTSLYIGVGIGAVALVSQFVALIVARSKQKAA
jgi:hypothetical protein